MLSSHTCILPPPDLLPHVCICYHFLSEIREQGLACLLQAATSAPALPLVQKGPLSVRVGGLSAPLLHCFGELRCPSPKVPPQNPHTCECDLIGE